MFEETIKHYIIESLKKGKKSLENLREGTGQLREVSLRGSLFLVGETKYKILLRESLPLKY